MPIIRAIQNCKKRISSSRRNGTSNNRRIGPSQKELSLDIEGATAGGVFVSTRSYSTGITTPATERELETSESSSIESGAGEQRSVVSSSSPPTKSWKSSGSREHNTKNCPLVVLDPESPKKLHDEAATLGRIMARSHHLPSNWYYSSNHVMVNKERTRRVVAPVVRMRELDDLATRHARAMVKEGRVYHSDPFELQLALANRPCRRLGENVARGRTIRRIHCQMMETRSQKNNITDRRFTHMGMGTAKGPDGEIYLCQIFRG